MAYGYFSRNGDILPVSQAVVPLDDIEYAYGFGVYETVRVSKGRILFLKDHCRRLLESARIISLPHSFSADFVARSVEELTAKNKAGNCNLKMLLIGGKSAEDATLNMLCLNPLFPDRQLYKQGARMITKRVERAFPHAKTLNMLPSYLANREAKAAGAYDALMINGRGCITEGTSTNFFAMKGRAIFSPPEADILLGVTRANVIKVAVDLGFEVHEQDIEIEGLEQYDNLFLTGTSIKIMPVCSIDERDCGQPGPALKELMQAFDNFLASY